MSHNVNGRHIQFNDKEKWKSLAKCLCKAVNISKELGVMDEDWTCERLLESPSFESEFEGYPTPAVTQQCLAAQTTGLSDRNMQNIRNISPETSGRTSGIGRSISPRREEINDVIDITDEEDRPPPEFRISPKRVPGHQGGLHRPQMTTIPETFHDKSYQRPELPRSPVSPSYPLQRARSKRSKMFKDIVQAFDELVQNINEQSRVLNESRLDSRNRTFIKTPGQSSYQGDLEESSDDQEDSSAYFQPRNISTPPSLSTQQRVPNIHLEPPTQSNERQATGPTQQTSRGGSRKIPQIYITPIGSSRGRCRTPVRKPCEKEDSGNTTALIYIRQEKGQSRKPIARELVFDKNFKGG